MLSTGPVWLFIFLGVVSALLPDILIGVWEAYAAGEGVLVNQVKPILLLLLFFPGTCRRNPHQLRIGQVADVNTTLPITLSDGHLEKP